MDDVNLDNELRALQQEQAKKRKLILIALGAVVVFGGGGAFLAVRHVAAANQARIEEAWSRASTCLIGDPVQTHDEAAAAFRNEQLGAMSLPLDKRGEPGQKAWPARCAEPLHALAQALRDTGTESALVESAKALATALDQPDSCTNDTSELVTRAWSDAQTLGLHATSVGARPLEPAHPMTEDSLPDTSRFLPDMVPLESLKTESTPSGRLVFLVDAKDQPNLPALCTAIPEQKRIECKALPESLERVCPGLELFGTSEESVPPFVFAGDRGQAGTYRSTDGVQVAQGLTYGASALADGSLVRTVWNDDKKEVWYAIHPANGKERQTKLLEYDEVGNPYYNSGLFWDWLVYKAWVDDGIKLLARKVRPDGELEPLQRVGELGQRSLVVAGEKRPHITACRTKKALVVRVKGTNEQYTAFYLGDGWRPPVASMGTEGDLTCSDTQAVITHLVPQMPEPWIYQTRCTAAVCQRSELSFKQMLRDVRHLLPQDPQRLTAAELGGKLLVLWGAGDRGGLRMRLAPADQVLKSPDQIVFDDVVRGGKQIGTSTLLATRLLPGADYALLFLSTGKGIFVLHVDREGKLSPVTTVFQ